MNKYKVLIVDDEPLAREIIVNYLSGMDEIEITGQCQNGFEALKFVQELKPDIMLLDIQMPKINGFELLEVMDEKPAIIFTTAFDQYAIKAFEMNAIDYLLKPFSKDRMQQAVDKAIKIICSSKSAQIEQLEKLNKNLEQDAKELERVVVRQGAKIVVIPIEKIWYFESQDDYVMIYSEIGNFLKDKTMKYFEDHLTTKDFVRIHRSHLVSVSQIGSIEQYSKDTHLVILKNGTKLKTSESGYKRLREIF